MNDIIIIGAGPGGYELAIKAAQANLKTLLIEKDKLGGVCLNAGCIPTKTYYHAASMLGDIKKLEKYGINTQVQFDYKRLKQRKNEIVCDLNNGINFSLEKVEVNLIYGNAHLVDRNTVSVNGELHKGKYIVIATGSHIAKLKGFEDDLYSDDILQMEELPKSLAIIGGGVIGIEMASIYNRFGVDVTVIESKDRIVSNYDRDISNRLQSFLKSEGIKFHLSSTCYKDGSSLVITKRTEEVVDSFDKILVCVGRRPNVEGLGLEEVGINFSEKGIIVDDDFRTNIDNIFAIGDVTGKNMLAHYATYSGYHVLNTILGKNSSIDLKNVPNCTFAFPEVASVGLNEVELTEKGIEYKTYKGLYKVSGKAATIDKNDGFVKLMVVDGKIVGASILGYDASTLIHELAIIVSKGIKINNIKDVVHAHPTLSEVISSLINEI